MPGCQESPLLTPRGKTGCLENTGRPSRVLSLNPEAGLYMVGQILSLASRGTKIKPFKNKK